MSELKVINLGNIRESIEKYEPVYYEYYAKSEADKMIAHHKYKRCLMMHEYCLCELEFAFRDPCVERSIEGCVRWRKWANLWLELAEEPTWAKFLQLIHKETAKDGM